MKTWVLVWFLVFPPAGPNQDVTWETKQEGGLTMTKCFEFLAEKDVLFKQLKDDGKVIGIQLYCKEDKSGLTLKKMEVWTHDPSDVHDFESSDEHD